MKKILFMLLPFLISFRKAKGPSQLIEMAKADIRSLLKSAMIGLIASSLLIFAVIRTLLLSEREVTEFQNGQYFLIGIYVLLGIIAAAALYFVSKNRIRPKERVVVVDSRQPAHLSNQGEIVIKAVGKGFVEGFQYGVHKHRMVVENSSPHFN